MNEVYNDLNRLKVHHQELRIQGARELVTELFGSAMATKMGVL